MDKKPIIFLSHIHEEKELAISLKKLIEASFIGAVHIFVSSDSSSNGAGERWLDNITNSLKSCVIAILLCSRESVKRPWLNFEAGAVWMRDILVVPICHSGLAKTELPIPLSLLNAVEIISQDELTSLFNSIANKIGLNVPNTDFSPFIQEALNFEERNQFWNIFDDYIKKLEKIQSGICNQLKTNKSVTLGFHQSSADRQEVELIKSFMEENNLLSFSNFKSNSNFGGSWYSYDINPLPKFASVVIENNKKVSEQKDILKNHQNNLIRYQDAYYEKDVNGNASGNPFCIACWDIHHKKISLVRSRNSANFQVCPSCKNEHMTHRAPPIKINQTSEMLEKPIAVGNCYQFSDNDQLYCSTCYDNNGKKILATKLGGRFYQCPDCQATLSTK